MIINFVETFQLIYQCVIFEMQCTAFKTKSEENGHRETKKRRKKINGKRLNISLWV